MSTTDCRCNGSGAYPYTEEGEPVVWADGTVVTSRSSGTHLCSCRRELEPREGEAKWWTTETVYHDVWSGCVSTVEFTVEAEVPISADNYIVHRRGNRYWPTSVDVDIDGRKLKFVDGSEAAEFVAAMQKAVDAAQALDAKDQDICGHWAPCDCGVAA